MEAPSFFTAKEKKAYANACDSQDETFCGQIALQTVDKDGYGKRTKGCSLTALTHLKREGDFVKFEAFFAADNKLFYHEINSRDDEYIFGTLWHGPDKPNVTSEIGKIVPKDMKSLNEELEKNNGICQAKLQLSNIRDSTERLCDIQIQTVTKKFLTKVVKITIAMPVAIWLESKTYRLRFFAQTKMWEAFKKGDDGDEEKDKKKDDA